MKTKTIPFDLETAKKIQAGEIEGRIKTRDSKDIDEIIFFRTILEYNIYAVIDGKTHSFTEEGFERSWDKSGKWHRDLVLEVPDNEPQFKPFDKVLVRNGDHKAWNARLFDIWFAEIGLYGTQDNKEYKQCIPYEGNEHLVGTTDKPKEE